MPCIGLYNDILIDEFERRHTALVMRFMPVNAFKLRIIQGYEFAELYAFISEADSLFGDGSPEQYCVFEPFSPIKLKDEAAVIACEQVLIELFIEGKAYAVAYRHLENALGYAACGRSPCGEHSALADNFIHIFEIPAKRLRLGKPVFVDFAFKEDDIMPGRLEFGRNYVFR